MITIAYILAASHSGSTLLSMVLGSHPQIATIGEMKLSSKAMGDLDHYRCSCGEVIHRCRFWEQVRDGMMRRGFTFDLADAMTDYRSATSCCARRLLAPLHRGRLLESVRDVTLGLCPAWRRQLPEIHKRNAALASTVLDLTGTQVVVDSSKVGLRLKYLLRNPELDVKVIHLVRDGRAVALTYMDPTRFADAQEPDRRGGGMGGKRQRERVSLEQATHRWCRCMSEAESMLRRLDPSRWMRVRYEECCMTLDETMSRLHQFVGVRHSTRAREFRHVAQHIVGNGMRLDTTSEVRLDERWRSVLTSSELRAFDAIAGKMNRRYGYLS